MSKLINVLFAEESFCKRLSKEERRVYSMNNEELATLATMDLQSVREYVKAARLLNELNQVHRIYDDIGEAVNDYYDGDAEVYEQNKKAVNCLKVSSSQLFHFVLTIGKESAVVNLEFCDNFLELKAFLIALKNNCFSRMISKVSAVKLIEYVKNV
jgi:hypothetical protein